LEKLFPLRDNSIGTSSMPPVNEAYHLPTKRPFSWRALWILVVLQLLGNLLSIPTEKKGIAP
jgi:hypothetical protein